MKNLNNSIIIEKNLSIDLLNNKTNTTGKMIFSNFIFNNYSFNGVLNNFVTLGIDKNIISNKGLITMIDMMINVSNFIDYNFYFTEEFKLNLNGTMKPPISGGGFKINGKIYGLNPDGSIFVPQP